MTESLKQRRVIRFLLFAAVVAVLGHAGARGQQNNIQGYNQVLGTWDMSHASLTNPNRQGTGSPNGRDTCTRVGESYFQIDATAGANLWYCTALPNTWTNSMAGAGTVTSVTAGSCLPWITCGFGASTTVTPALAIGAATGQTSHQVIGTCGSATSFGPCALTGAELPNPTASTLGGVESIGAASHNWISYIDTSGAPHQSQPACGDLINAAASCSTDATNASNISTGTLGAGRLPNSTGYSVIAGNGGGSTLTSGATVYFGQGVSANAAIEIARSTVMPVACTLRGFNLITTSTQSTGGGSTSLVATVRVAQASPSGGPVINIAASAGAGPYSDSTDTATVAAGQVVDIQITNNGSGTSAGIGGWSIGCVPN